MAKNKTALGTPEEEPEPVNLEASAQYSNCGGGVSNWGGVLPPSPPQHCHCCCHCACHATWVRPYGVHWTWTTNASQVPANTWYY